MRSSRIIIALWGVLAVTTTNAELLNQAYWNVVDTETDIEWRAPSRSLQAGEIQPGQYLGSYNDVISRYDADSTYRLPTAAEVDDLLGKLFPGFVANDAEGRCSETTGDTGGYPGQVEQVDAFRAIFGYDDAHVLYETAGGEMRALWVSRSPYGSNNRKVCLTGPWNSYEKYRVSPGYPSTLLSIFVVRDVIDRKAPSLNLYSYLAPTEIGLAGETLLFGTVFNPYYQNLSYFEPSDNFWSSPYVGPDYTGQTYRGEFELRSYPSAYQRGQVAPWVRVKSLEYTGACASGDADIGDNWCRRTFTNPAYEFTGELVNFPGTYIANEGKVDNIQIEQIWSNVEIDFDPWNAANEIEPKLDKLITVQITTTSTADGDEFDFDSATVDPNSLRLGPDAAEIAGPYAILTNDLDGDGDTDYIFGFRSGATGVTCLDSEIVIAGRTLSGDPIAGFASINPSGCEETIDIDVDPFNAVNTIRPNDDYNITVAVLGMSIASGDAIDLYSGTNADGLDVDTLRFGPAETPPVGSAIVTDIDGDSLDDMLVNFNVFDAGIACGDTEVDLIGNKNSGIPLEAFDAIVTEDCDTGGCHP